ncbi:TraR/DksA family transcriptional regulator [Streptomyces coffeae]|uniref:TraR/DksA C4-type zinc finger protein n=1 Tax=Streptomyces coffeae TaxID=621382 RepID=A0ABS1NAW4_9ACTN|nr:TraR/DksA C4-type zinc finger protein [Streptomyces coffeae]MBL1097049.1 TraR/DksA C4-type zinc finger protein [Streptomyces coffeae]
MVARKTAVQKSTAKATQAAPAEKSTSGKKAAKKTAAAAKSTAKATAKAAKKSAPTKKTTAKKAAPAKKAVPAKKTGARKVVAKKTPGGAPTAKKATTTAPPVPKARAAGAPVDPSELAVRPGEDPWSAEEVAEARAELLTEAGRLRTEILASEEAITGLMRDSGDGAGDDQADTGTKNITREHEMALAGNAREMLLQTERALERLDAGTYGLCENCGNPIGKARMQAFPRATLCVECKQRQERR